MSPFARKVVTHKTVSAIYLANAVVVWGSLENFAILVPFYLVAIMDLVTLRSNATVIKAGLDYFALKQFAKKVVILFVDSAKFPANADVG